LHAADHEVILAGHTEASLVTLAAELGADHVSVDATRFDALDQSVRSLVRSALS
jgi:NADP-dependent 3-hydroxy acid dehydrogenase YdfG